jgi:UDP-glucuronate decarboxylase
MDPDDGRVVSNFILQALRGDDITIYGKGDQSRSFCYVDDMIEGLIRLMNTEDDYTSPVNLGNPDELKMLELADLIRELTGSDSGISYMELPDDDPMQRQPDISKAVKDLNWKPTTPLRDGIGRTVEYFKELI